MSKKLKDEDLILNVIINGDRGKKEMLKLERTIKDTERQLRALERAERQARQEGKANKEELKQFAAAIKQKKQAIQLATARLQELRSGMDLAKMSTSDLRKEMARLAKLRNISTPYSKQWHAFDQQLQKVKKRYNEINGANQQTGLSLKKLAGKFNHYFGLIAAGAATVAGAITGIRKSIEDFAALEDKMSDVQKTSGLLESSVRNVNESLKEVDTRTAQESLLGLARIGGKLGNDTEEALEQFVRATDQIVVALSEDLGGDVEETVTIVGKLVDIFQLDEDFGLEKSILKIGSLINSLGAASTASEGAIVDFITRTSGLAKNFDVSVTDMAGLGAVVDQLNLSIETAGTTYNQVVPNMLKDTKTFAGIARMEYSAFAKLLETDVNEAFLAVLEGVQSSSTSNIAFIEKLQELGISGARVTNIIGALAANTEKIRKEQILASKSFAEGTSITDEFNIKNTNAAAELEKARKRMAELRVELGARLFPVMKFSTKGMTIFLKVLKNVIDFVDKYGKELIVLTALIATYSIALKIANFRMAESALLIKARIFWDKALRASTLLAAAAQALFTGNTVRATAAMRLFNTTTKLNPLLLFISVLVAAGAALIAYSGRLSSAEKAQKSLIDVEAQAKKSILDEKLALDKLLRVAKDEKASKDDRIAAIEKLQQLSPDYLEGLSLETINTDKAKLATDRYVESLLKKARVQAAEEKLKKLAEKEIDLETKGEGVDPTFIQKMKANLAVQLEYIGGINIGAADIVAKQANDAFNAAKESIEAERKALLDYIANNQDKPEPVEDTGGPGKTTPKVLTKEEIAKRYNTALRAIRQGEMQLTEELRAQLLARKITEEQYQERIKELHLSSLLAKKEAMLLAGLDTLSIDQEINDATFALLKSRQQKEQEAKEAYANWKLNHQERVLNEIEKGVDAELEIQQKKDEADEEFFKRMRERKEEEIKLLEKRKEAEITAAIQSATSAVESAETIKEAGVAVINSIRAQINARLQEAVATQMVKVLKKVPFPFNVIAASVAAAGVSLLFNKLIPKARVKEVDGAESGGRFQDVIRRQDGKRFNAENRPSARGFLQRPTLLVSERGTEFVANAQAVENPSIKPILDVIDTAQRNGTISTLRLARVLDAPERVTGYQIGGYTDSARSPGSTGNHYSSISDTEIKELLEMNYQVNAALMRRLERPIKSEISYRQLKEADDDIGKAKGSTL